MGIVRQTLSASQEGVIMSRLGEHAKGAQLD